MTTPNGPNAAPAPATPLVNQTFDQGSLNRSTYGNSTGAADNISQLQGTTPPPLRTFIYSPEIRIIIAHNGMQFDMSDDIVRATIHRPENSAATLFFTVHNKGLRYTPTVGKPFFSRMDRVVVYLKKTTWVQVFAGYLDTIPFKSLYPGTVDFKATCTIKRLMYTYWNPDLTQSSQILNQLSTPEVALGGDAQGGNDSGLGSMLRRLLVVVGGWDVMNIHIQNFPQSFYLFLKQQVERWQTANAPNVERFKQMLLGSDTSPGPGAYAGQDPSAGVPGPVLGVAGGAGAVSIAGADAQTAFYVGQIVAACDAKGYGPQPSDNNLAAGLIQAGGTGSAAAGIGNGADNKAWEQVTTIGQDYQNANRNSDAAILGVACAMAETGGGVAIRNLYNPSVPGSEQFPNDGAGTDGTSTGIFQQQNTAQWGNLSQRMNPRQAATMFFNALPQGWRTMDPGAAIQMVQNSGLPTRYTAAVALATSMVQAYRTSQAGQVSSVIPSAGVGLSAPLGTSVPQAASTLGSAVGGGAPSSAPNAVVGAASQLPTPSLNTSATTPLTSTGRPQPDSEGAINFCMTVAIGKPYVWGAKGPNGYDCSGLMNAAFKSIGVDVPGQTDAIRSSVRQVPKESVQRGDLVEPSTGHVILWCGDGTIIEAPHSGAFVQRIPNPYPQSGWAWVGRACANGGPSPTAAYGVPWTMGPGSPPSAMAGVGGVTGTGSGGSQDGVGRNLFSYTFTASRFAATIADFFPGEKAFLDGQPLLEAVQAVASAGLRCWSSGPNGDFMAWYPDYFGLDGKAAVLRLADIELEDVNINFSDDSLTTHVYVQGDWSMMGNADPVMGWIDTAGVVTVEQTWLYQYLILAAPGDLETASGQQIMQRFGVRPLKQQFAMAGSHELEFLLACQVFLERYAAQYQTQISMTFMPELFPGMRVELGNSKLQVYVSSVTHVCDYEQGFVTQATIMSPSNPGSKQLMMNVKPNAAPDQFTLEAILDPFRQGVPLG